MGRRDPARGEDLAVQTRFGPRARRGAGGPGGDLAPTIGCDRSLRGDAVGPDSRQAADAAHRPPPQRRAVPALRRPPRGGLLRGLRDVLLPDLPDRGQAAQGPTAVEAAEVGQAARFGLGRVARNALKSTTLPSLLSAPLSRSDTKPRLPSSSARLAARHR